MAEQVIELGELAELVRRASLAGAVVRLDGDIVAVREGEHTYLYSERHMTRQYAESAARAAAGDPARLIAETVRYDSETYPRPTPVETFGGPPFLLTADAVSETVGRMSTDPAYADIRLVKASDGSEFLFSATRMNPDHAESLAEWLAVGQFDSP